MRPSRPYSAPPAAVTLLTALVALAGCAGPRAAKAPDAPGSPAPDVPLRPVDVANASVSRAVFALHPVGVVPFVGPMLPLSSPAADYLAVPLGAPVPWPAVLADTSAAPDPLSRIRVYALKPGSAVELSWSNSLPRGLVLGRSCDDSGFLVEAPQADGSRWIGKVAWGSASERDRLVWLVQGGALNAHAALGTASRLVYTSRPAAGGPADLIVQIPGSPDPLRIPAPPDSTFFAPWFEGPRIASLLISSAGIELVQFSLEPGAAGAQVSRRMLAPGVTSAGAAFQIVAPQHLAPGRRGAPRGVVFDPSLDGVTPVDETGALTPLDRGSVGAAPTDKFPGPGWLVTTPDGLAFRSHEAIAANRQDRVRISDVPFLPRLTGEPGRFLLLGPNASGVSPSLQILMLQTAPPPTNTKTDPETGHSI